MLLGGPELLPVSLDQAPLQIGGFVLVEFAKPLKLEGGVPPLKEFSDAQFAPQKVT